MIAKLFKKKRKTSSPRPARKAVTAEKPKPKAKAMHQKILTAEGWKRMMMRSRKSKKA
jgi:hypothetical protein